MNRENLFSHSLILFISLFFILLITSCNTTKFIPEGEYLLDKVSIKIDDKGVKESELTPYIQQTPNNSTSVGIYNLVNNDSNFFKKAIRKLGEPGIIYKHNMVDLTIEELTAQTRNLGYLNANVSAEVDTASAEKKARVTYYVHNGEPYKIRNFTNNISIMNTGRRSRLTGRNSSPEQTNTTQMNDSSSRRRRQPRNRSLIKEGTTFDMNILENEINRVSTILRNQGYYTLTPNNLHYLADTTLRSNQVDLSMILLDSTQVVPYKIQKVSIFSGFDPAERDSYSITDSVIRNGIHIYYDKSRYLRPRVIESRVLVRPDNLFRERTGQSTYSLFQSLSGMGRVDLQYEENNYADSTLLDCNIYLTPGNNHSVQLGVEGTNKAGDLGVALDIVYGNLNIFNGGEIFNVHTRTSYEFVRSQSADAINSNFYEIGVTPSFTFPKLHFPYVNKWFANRFTSKTTYSIGYNIQRRPEFARNFFNFNWKFSWSGQRNNLTQNLSLLDINYVNMPWQSDYFKNTFLPMIDPITRHSYDDVFTAGIGYNLIYTNANRGRIRQNLYTIRFSAESSGNLLYALFSASNANKSETGQYNILGNPFAQYIKGNIDFSQTFPFTPSSSLAFHVGIGVAYPYKNSTILPFEKRYYAGGPNHVRGWSTRYLGPGSFSVEDAGDQAMHVGDINFITSVEYRQKVLPWLEPAFFIDAGNVWTIKSYESQPGGLFEWNKFYKEIAVATGIGLRFDLSFLVVRLDAGTRVYDPGKEEGSRFVLFKGKFFKNSALHFAIGYPF